MFFFTKMKVIGLSVNVVGTEFNDGCLNNTYALKLTITNHMNDFVIINKISLVQEFLSFFQQKTEELSGELGKKLELGDGSIDYIQTKFKKSKYSFFTLTPNDKAERKLVIGAGQTEMVAVFNIALAQLTKDNVVEWLGEFSRKCGRETTVEGKTASGEQIIESICVSLSS